MEEAGVVAEKEAEAEDEKSKPEGGEDRAEDEEESWLKSDRDYTYEEVSGFYSADKSSHCSSYCIEYSASFVRTTHLLVSVKR